MGGVDKADILCKAHGLSRKYKKWWHRLFFGIIDRTIINAWETYSKLDECNLTTLDFRRAVTQTPITLARPPKVGRPLSFKSPPLPKKRRLTGYTVSNGIWLQNRGAHWVTYDKKRGRCEVCAWNEVESRPHSICSMWKVFCVAVRRKIAF